MTKALFILGELDNDDLDWISQKSNKKILAPGETLIYEGQTINALYIVLEGMLSVSIKPLANKELARIFSGEVVGEISFIDTRPPVATVKAIEESVVLEIPRLQLIKKLQSNLGFASRFYRGISMCLSDRMRGTVRRLGYGFEESEQRNAEEEDVNPIVLKNWDVAQVKFQWLVQNALN